MKSWWLRVQDTIAHHTPSLDRVVVSCIQVIGFKVASMCVVFYDEVINPFCIN